MRSDMGSARPEPSFLCIVVQVNVPERLMVLSERAAYMADLSRTLKKGDVVEGTVQKLTDYGAFVSITAADGTQHGTDVRLQQLRMLKGIKLIMMSASRLAELGRSRGAHRTVTQHMSLCNYIHSDADSGVQARAVRDCDAAGPCRR